MAYPKAHLKATVLALMRNADALRYWTWLLCLVYITHLAESSGISPEINLTDMFSQC